MNEQELREKIAEELMNLDLSEAKEVSADYYAATLRTRMVCAAVVRHGAK